MERIDRRGVLAALGLAAGSGVLAGCLEDRGGQGAIGGGEPPTALPPEGDLPTACPDYDVERVICYDEADLGAVDGFLEPSARSVEEGDPIEFELRNESGRTLETNFYNWRIDKHVDGEWHRVAPLFVHQPLMTVSPGASHTWTLTAEENDGIEAGDEIKPAGGTGDLTVQGLGGGHYAFRGRGWFEGESHEEDTAFAATFEIDADPLELTPSNEIADTGWDGEVLVADSTRGDPDSEHTRLGAYELERVEESNVAEADEEPRQMIVEGVVRNEQLRDAIALAHEHDADSVRLEEYDSTHPIFGSRTDGFYEFQGSYYEVTTRELDG